MIFETSLFKIYNNLYLKIKYKQIVQKGRLLIIKVTALLLFSFKATDPTLVFKSQVLPNGLTSDRG